MGSKLTCNVWSESNREDDAHQVWFTSGFMGDRTKYSSMGQKKLTEGSEALSGDRIASLAVTHGGKSWDLYGFMVEIQKNRGFPWMEIAPGFISHMASLKIYR